MTQQTEGGVPAETEDEVSRLMMAWRQEVSGKGTRRLRKLLLIPPILLCACFATVYISTKAGLLILCCAFPIGLLILALLDTEPRDSRRLTPAQRQILADMASLEDLHAIDVLIQKLGQMPQGTVIYRAATDTLTRLLSHLKTEEATCIILHRSALYARLNAYTATQFPDLVIALLRILPSFPDREALSRTAYLIAHDAPTHAQQQVRNAARVCFTDLLQAVDFGSPAEANLKYWIHKLSGIEQMSMSWDEFILPQMAIRQLLPRMTVKEFLALDAHDRRRLYRSLTWKAGYSESSVDVARLGCYGLALLDIALRAHDLEALSTVRLLAGQVGNMSKTLSEAARDYLPAFEALANQEKVSRTLLRAGNAPEAEPEQLLRSAQSIASTDVHQLLRVRNEEEN